MGVLGYKEYDTGRKYMAKMGDWRDNKDEEIELDGIGGVNILVKADVHKSGKTLCLAFIIWYSYTQASTSHATHSRTKPRQKASQRWQNEQSIKSLVCQTMLYGTLTLKRSLETLKATDRLERMVANIIIMCI